MKAKKCDKCGCFYTKNTVPSRGRIHGGVLDGIATRSDDYCDENFDLCDDCIKELFEWLGCNEVTDHE